MRRIEKPPGLYAITLVDFAAFGVLQFFKIIADAQKSAEEASSFAMIFVALFLCVFTAAAAIWAFAGDNAGRYALLFFISLNILWIIVDVSALMINEGFSSSGKSDILLAAGKAVFGFAANWWYLTTDEVVAYFKQQSGIK